jgi:DNA-binding HxlR family transcriptional regulator
MTRWWIARERDVTHLQFPAWGYANSFQGDSPSILARHNTDRRRSEDKMPDANYLQVRNFLLVLPFMSVQTQCPVAFTSRILGGKWKARIVWALIRRETLRFSEIRRACPPISDRILSKELKELEGCGLIVRREYSTIPPKTEYSLTALGQTLRPAMAAMAAWGTEHRSTISDLLENGTGHE